MESNGYSNFRAILFVQCAQGDFMAPDVKKPSDVYIGREEALRLVGPQGKLVEFLRTAHKVAERSDLLIVYVNDIHNADEDQKHLEQFGYHALAGTRGAEIIFPLNEMVEENANVMVIKGAPLDDIAAGTLTSELGWNLGSGCFDQIRIGVIGCWTDAKVSNMIANLRNLLKAPEVATCSMLTASNSNKRHGAALENIQLIHGAIVFDSPGSFLEWLRNEPPPLATESQSTLIPMLNYPSSWSNNQRIEASSLLYKLIPDYEQLYQFGGGYSGCLTIRVTTSSGSSVVKIGVRDEIAAEYNRHYSMSQGLRGHVPKLSGHVEGPTLGGFAMTVVEGKQRRNTAPITLQGLWQQHGGSPTRFSTVIQALTVALTDGLGAIYGTAGMRTLDLFKAYYFTNSSGKVPFANSIISSATKVARELQYDDVAMALADLCKSSIPYFDPVVFYKDWLTGQQLLLDVPESLVHADLNLQNILLSEGINGLEDLWLIDFARLSNLPVFTDFAKIENDLGYILTAIADRTSLERRIKLQNWILTGSLALEDYAEADELTDDEYYYLVVLKHLRKLMLKHIDDSAEMQTAYRTAQLRYAAHTLSFDEPTLFQRGLALVGCGILCGAIFKAVTD
jgi:hypothetical protein